MTKMTNFTLLFDVLPIHPALKDYESLTSYIIRLGQANRISTYKGLAYLLFPETCRRKAKNYTDLPPSSVRTIAKATNQAEERILESTLHYLGINFGRSPNPQSLARFLNGAISQTLRYCPICIKENQYYSIFWNFKHILGCETHNCLLLNSCPQCGNKINAIELPLRIGICPTCNFDLRNSLTTQISVDDSIKNNCLLNDLKYFLSSKSYPNHFTVGNILKLYRIYSNISLSSIEHMTQIDKECLSVFEVNKYLESGGVNFSKSLSYIKCLNTYFHQIITKSYITNNYQESHIINITPSHNEKITDSSSSQNSISKLKNKTSSSLKNRPSCKKLYREILIAQDYFEKNNEYCSISKLANFIGVGRNTIYYYPEIRNQVVNNQSSVNKINSKIAKIIKIIDKHSEELIYGELIITKELVSETINTPYYILSNYEELVNIIKEIQIKQRKILEQKYLENLERLLSAENTSEWSFSIFLSALNLNYKNIKYYPLLCCEIQKYAKKRNKKKSTAKKFHLHNNNHQRYEISVQW